MPTNSTVTARERRTKPADQTVDAQRAKALAEDHEGEQLRSVGTGSLGMRRFEPVL